MFNPSRQQVRQFFCDVWHKHCTQKILSPLESIALKWILEHPEYHSLLTNQSTALTQDFGVNSSQTNPFLHLAMHLSISEQVTTDQPSGIHRLSIALTQKLNSEHEGQHRMMECLEEILWKSQHHRSPLDSEAYLKCVNHQLTHL